MGAVGTGNEHYSLTHPLARHHEDVKRVYPGSGKIGKGSQDALCSRRPPNYSVSQLSKLAGPGEAPGAIRYQRREGGGRQ